MSDSQTPEAAPVSLDELVGSEAPRHEALHAELAALSNVEGNLALAQGQAEELRRELRATSSYIKTARDTARAANVKLADLKKRSKGGKLVRTVLGRGQKPPPSELAIAEKELVDAQSQVQAMEALAETTKHAVREERDTVENLNQLAIRHKEIENELDMLYVRVFGGDGTLPDNRLAVAERHIVEANAKMTATSMKDNPTLMATLVEQCQEATGMPMSVLLQDDHDLFQLVQHIHQVASTAPPPTLQPGSTRQPQPAGDYDLSFIETEKDLRDYIKIIRSDASRVAKDAAAARRKLRQDLQELFENILLQNMQVREESVAGPSTSRTIREEVAAGPSGSRS